MSMTGNPAEVLPLLITAHFDALLLDNWMTKINESNSADWADLTIKNIDFLLLWGSHRGR